MVGDTFTASLVVSAIINQFYCNVLLIAIYCLRLFVVVYKHLHTVDFDQGDKI